MLLGLLVLAPLAAPGYVLSYDMVAVPDQALLPSSIGLSSALPRAVPLDAVVAVADSVVPGAVLQRLVLGAIVVGGALGAASALPSRSPWPRLVAASVYGWNAYLAERLVLGHWPVLIAYAALPWLLVAARRMRAGRPGAGAAGVVLVGAASVTATGGIIATVLFATQALVPGGTRRRSRRLLPVLAAVALQAPWVVPGVFRPGSAVSDAAGVEAFATRADMPWGLPGSVATLGGVWNAAVVPDSRAAVSSALLSAVVVVLAAAGLRELARRVGRAEVMALGGLAAAGIVLAIAGAVPAGEAAVQWLVTHVPGSGLIRDGQKFLAWYAPLLALAAASGAAALARAVGDTRARTGTRAAPTMRAEPTGRAGPAVLIVAALLPVAALPDLAWGAAGRLTPVEYPAEWSQVRTALAQTPGDGDLVVLPFQPFRSFPWTDGRTVLDPAPRFLRIETVVPDTLPVGGTVVPGEDERAARVGAALRGPEPLAGLAAAGVGWVAVHRDTPGTVPTAVTSGAEPVELTGRLDLYRVPGTVEPWTEIPSARPVVLADIVFLVIVVGASVDLVRIACLGRRRSLRSPVS
ncbi:hypothetical protein CLV30_10677 [Haloactinopolyspora alba]|uniref:Membrane protein YfhO n=1 Tax=Haloactinopolyspora alba TaxID=648780 RepID=A0A2P8E3M1_9ACTN|nr:hypothetical protein CLV30_10677 [Haloactinopolyspora alba]